MAKVIKFSCSWLTYDAVGLSRSADSIRSKWSIGESLMDRIFRCLSDVFWGFGRFDSCPITKYSCIMVLWLIIRSFVSEILNGYSKAGCEMIGKYTKH